MKTARFFGALAALALLAAGSAGMYSQAAPAAARTTGPAPQLVILDTDIGDDIDDAFALALVLRSPELRLLGVETAFGDTELRARLVDRYLKAVGHQDIPVLAGVETKSVHFTQAAYAKQAPQQKHKGAVDFLLEQIRAHPGQITLIAIGPLFNVQAAIVRDPATFKKLKRVVIMGGSVYRGYDGKDGDKQSAPSPEWNILCDPEGATALLGSGVPVFVMPLDSTQIHLENPALGAILAHGSPLTDQLTLLYHQWTGANEWRRPTLFDPVAVTYVIRPDLCPATPMRLEVDDKGFTRPVEGSPNAQVCLHSDEEGFMELMVSRITTDTVRR
ncbi:MAG TPA: nucleoside hydrolase [Terracidiphilus sp.]|nr:nucleoside hydrolase [Terracidiphilus sp.]